MATFDLWLLRPCTFGVLVTLGAMPGSSARVDTLYTLALSFVG